MKKTVLWAMHGYCKYACSYCYFRNIQNLSKDFCLEVGVERIVNQFYNAGVQRVFLAGAEPLQYNDIFGCIKLLKEKGIEVILCTNGYDLTETVCEQITDCMPDGVSVSLDSYKKEYNDAYRGYPNGNGMETVVSGIKRLVSKAELYDSKMKIGIYTVLTKVNLQDLCLTFEYAQNLNVDYFVFQPVYLSAEDEEKEKLSLNRMDYKVLRDEIEKMKIIQHKTKYKTKLPSEQYIDILLKMLQNPQFKPKCSFSGRFLKFVTYDGWVYKCPSEGGRREAEHILNLNKQSFENSDEDVCKFFNEDCVNMWQLMNFDSFLDNTDVLDL